MSDSSPAPALSAYSSPAALPPAPGSDALANPFPDDDEPPAAILAPASEKDAVQEHLTANLPDLSALDQEREKALALGDPARILRWIRDVIRYLARDTDGTRRANPQVDVLIQQAAVWVNRIAEEPGVPPAVQAEALMVRGDLRGSGSIFPRHYRKHMRAAFDDYDRARHGCAEAWGRIGKEYESLRNNAAARGVYLEGVKVGDMGCQYRIAMAKLMGQLDLTPQHWEALSLLRMAANSATLDIPQPAYIYAMVLVQEFESLMIVPELLQASVAQGGNGRSIEAESAHYLEKAAYLHFAPAQLKLGWAYENARLDLPFDPLLSVQWYSLASQGGQIEADMALSKWFLCGADKQFDVNEALAYQFAEKAAQANLSTALFAMGYYHETGVGCTKNLDTAKEWYTKASDAGNQDAKDRLTALFGSQAHADGFSRQQHQQNLNQTIQRSRTLAAQRTIARRQKRGASGAKAGQPGRAGAGQTQVQPQAQAQAQPLPPSFPPTLEADEVVPASTPPRTSMPSTPSGSPAPVQGQWQQEPLRRKQTLSMAQAAAGRGRYGRGRGGRAGGRSSTGASSGAPSGAPAPAGAGAGAGTGYGAGTAAGAPEELAPAPPRPAGVKYNTFADMGFQPKKQSKDDCIVM